MRAWGNAHGGCVDEFDGCTTQRYEVDVFCYTLLIANKYPQGFTIGSAWLISPAHGSKTPDSLYLIP